MIAGRLHGHCPLQGGRVEITSNRCALLFYEDKTCRDGCLLTGKIGIPKLKVSVKTEI